MKTTPVNTARGPKLAVDAISFIKKQMAHKKPFPMFHLLTTKALKLWLWTGVPMTKLCNPLAFEIKVQMRVTSKSNKHFLGCPWDDWPQGHSTSEGPCPVPRKILLNFIQSLQVSMNTRWVYSQLLLEINYAGHLESVRVNCAGVKCTWFPTLLWRCYDQMTQARCPGWLEFFFLVLHLKVYFQRIQHL